MKFRCMFSVLVLISRSTSIAISWESRLLLITVTP